MHMYSATELDDRLDPLMCAALDGSLSHAIVELLAIALPDAVAMVVVQDHDRCASNFVLHASGAQTLTRVARLETAKPNGWMAALWKMEVGRVYHDRDLRTICGPATVIDGLLDSAPPSQDCIAGIVCFRNTHRQMTLEIRFAQSQEAKLRLAATDLLRRLAQQMKFALRINDLRRQRAELDHLSDSLLDFVPFPALLLDGARRLLRMNTRAQLLLEAGSAFSIAPDGTLHVVEQAEDAEFEALLDGLRSSLRQRGAVMTLRRARTAPPALLSVVRFGPAPLNAQILPPVTDRDESVRFAVICEDLSAPLQLTQDILWRVFGMSPREAELASSLLGGASIGDLAVSRQVSKETLRNQLAGIMRKTETSRQQDLLAMLTRIAALDATL